MMSAELWVYFVGYGFSLVIEEVFDNYITVGLLKTIKIKVEERGYNTILLDVLDKFLFTTSWLLGYPQFIGFWLVFKGLTKWDKVIIELRNINIIHHALSLIYGVFGGIMIKMIRDNQNQEAIIISVSIILFSLIERIPRSLLRGKNYNCIQTYEAAPFLSLRDILPPAGAGKSYDATSSLAPFGGKGPRVRGLSC